MAAVKPDGVTEVLHFAIDLVLSKILSMWVGENDKYWLTFRLLAKHSHTKTCF